MFFGKPLEYWATLVGMILYVATRAIEGDPILRRLAKLTASGFLAYGVGPSVAPFLWHSEIAALVIIMCVGQMVLNALTAVFSDPAFLKRLIRDRIFGRFDE